MPTATKHTRSFRFVSQGYHDLVAGLRCFFPHGQLHLWYGLTENGIVVTNERSALYDHSYLAWIQPGSPEPFDNVIPTAEEIQNWLNSLSPDDQRRLCPERPMEGSHFTSFGGFRAENDQLGDHEVLLITPALA